MAIIFGVLALCLIVIAGVVAAVFLSGSGGSSATYKQKLTAAFEPVVGDNRALSDSLTALHGKNVSAAQRAVARAQSATTSAQGALGALNVPSDSQQLGSQARQALDREQSYLSAISLTLANPSNERFADADLGRQPRLRPRRPPAVPTRPRLLW